MRLLYLFISSLLLMCCSTAFAAVITVTSNADAGPGTLRDAIMQATANGLSTQDFIYFNLPGTTLADRTINLASQLPDLPPSLSIDGTTQPGDALSVNGAKVVLHLTNTGTAIIIFSLRHTHDVSLYGMVLSGNPEAINYGFYLQASKNIIVGSPDKGNVVKNLERGIFCQVDPSPDPALQLSENVRISSNLFGLNEDGQSIDDNGGATLDIRQVKNLTFGGSPRTMGNVVSGFINIRDEQTIATGNLVFKENLIGVNYNGTQPLPNNANNIFIFSVQRSTCVISDNMISFSNLTLAVNCFFKIQKNQFGTNLTNTQVFEKPGPAMLIANCSDGGIIGGNGPGEGNIISGSYLGAPNGGANIINQSSEKVEVVGNVFKCNNSSYAYSASFAPGTHYVTITARNSNAISGTADPDSRVDLYYSSGDCPTCEPEQIFAHIQTDAAGKWQYSGSVEKNKYIIAAATINGTTSEFSRLKFTHAANDVQITNACNNRNGAITGITVSEPVTYTWYDAANNIVSTQKDLMYASSGTYKLVVSNGFCSVASQTFRIDPVTSFIPVPNVKGDQICAPGMATLRVEGPISGETYRVYNTPEDAVPLDEQPDGFFKVRVNNDRSFYISRIEGTCESERVEAKVSIGVPDITIPNTITPNADGINDVWNIKGIDNYATAQVDIFNRNGQKVYVAANGYSQPFNGNLNGSALAAGTYYYVIRLSGQCKILSGYLTILR